MSRFDETRDITNHMCDVKLKMNSHKGAIEEVDRQILLKLLRDEINELEKADTMINTIEEAADCINYITAIVHQVVRKYRSK